MKFLYILGVVTALFDHIHMISYLRSYSSSDDEEEVSKKKKKHKSHKKKGKKEKREKDKKHKKKHNKKDTGSSSDSSAGSSDADWSRTTESSQTQSGKLYITPLYFRNKCCPFIFTSVNWSDGLFVMFPTKLYISEIKTTHNPSGEDI